MYENRHEVDFISQDQINTINTGVDTFRELYEEWIDRKIKIDELQTCGFWRIDENECDRSTKFRYENLHLEAHPLDNPVEWIRPDGTPEFIQWMKDIKPKFDIEAYHYYIMDLLENKFPDQDIKWNALYDLRYVFNTHTDGRDVKNKRDPRPENWDDLKYEDWHQEDDWEYTFQGLINIDAKDPNDGTVIFDQTFPYSVYVDMSTTPEEPLRFGQKFRKQMIRFAKGDSIERFGAKIQKWTDKPMSHDDYLWIMENGNGNDDHSEWPIDCGYGLSVEDILTFETPGTMYCWDSSKFHITRPGVKDKKRLTLSFVCGQYKGETK